MSPADPDVSGEGTVPESPEQFFEEKAASRYPFDIEQLRKGEYIEPERCAQIVGGEPGSKEYQLGLLRLGDWIEKESREGARPLHCCIRRDGIYVLLDEEDVDYQDRQGRAGLRRFMRTLWKLREVDVLHLTDTTRRKRDELLCRRGAQIAALRGVKELPAPPKD